MEITQEQLEAIEAEEMYAPNDLGIAEALEMDVSANCSKQVQRRIEIARYQERVKIFLDNRIVEDD